MVGKRRLALYVKLLTMRTGKHRLNYVVDDNSGNEDAEDGQERGNSCLVEMVSQAARKCTSSISFNFQTVYVHRPTISSSGEKTHFIPYQ